MQTSLVSFMYSINIYFPLKIVIGVEEISQINWEDTGPHLIEVLSLNIYLWSY